MDDHIIMGIHITARTEHASQVQALLTKYGGSIKTRLGLHETNGQPQGSPNGLLILELVGDESRIAELETGLNGIDGVDAKRMHFPHD